MRFVNLLCLFVAIVNEEIVKNESDEIDEGHTGRRV